MMSDLIINIQCPDGGFHRRIAEPPNVCASAHETLWIGKDVPLTLMTLLILSPTLWWWPELGGDRGVDRSLKRATTHQTHLHCNR